MPRIKYLALGAFAAALLTATGAHAASVLNDPFALNVLLEDTDNGPFFGVAGAAEVDVNVNFGPEFFSTDVSVDWVDADSFDLFFRTPAAVDQFETRFTLSGLDFTDGGQSHIITGAAFKIDESKFLGFFFSPENETAPPFNPSYLPNVGFTAHSVTVSFSSVLLGLAADGPTLRVDVTTAAAAVPEPGNVALLLGGLAGMGAMARVRRRAARR